MPFCRVKKGHGEQRQIVRECESCPAETEKTGGTQDDPRNSCALASIALSFESKGERVVRGQQIRWQDHFGSHVFPRRERHSSCERAIECELQPCLTG